MSAGMWICEPESGKYGMQKYLYTVKPVCNDHISYKLY